jgi:hypothetical protein
VYEKARVEEDECCVGRIGTGTRDEEALEDSAFGGSSSSLALSQASSSTQSVRLLYVDG